jgi:uncharacterized protein YndB with AHSA1/START domain
LQAFFEFFFASLQETVAFLLQGTAFVFFLCGFAGNNSQKIKTMSNEPLTVENVLDAPVTAAWSAITNNNEIKQWYFQLEEFKPEVGFKFSFLAGSEEKKYLHLCEITEVEPGKKLTYRWRYDGYPGNSFVTWELEPQGEKTKLTITHRGIESMAANGQDFAKSSFTKGWTYFATEALPGYLEKK